MKIIIVGIDIIPCCDEVLGFSSVFIFAITTLLFSEAISSSTGVNALQGPHHGAQKSTKIKSFFFTVSSKFVSVTSIALICLFSYSERT
ncbi:uncharacterized protein METZ01_LOCUS306653 [marine metagenome]|uniref:Uncharacterized protein n=1 Tax=marine metagenome TaxID=408172 RepID=A0A382MY32_9ZZZZ